MNKLFASLIVLSIFSLAEDVKSLEGTLSSSIDEKITLSTKVLNSWFGTDMKVVVPDLNHTVTAFPFDVVLENKRVKLVEGSKVTITVPKTKLTVEVDSRCISEHGKNIYNAEAGVRYTFKSGFGVETGYKIINLDSDEVVDDLKIDSDSLGLYGRLVMAF